MVNPAHVEVVKLGARSIQAWRDVHPGISLELQKAQLACSDLAHADLAGVDFSQSYLSHASLHHANLSGATMRGTDLRNSNIAKANLTNASLQDANLCRSNLHSSALGNASFFGAYMYRAILVESTFDGADFTGAYLVEAHLPKKLRATLTGSASIILSFADLIPTGWPHPVEKDNWLIAADYWEEAGFSWRAKWCRVTAQEYSGAHAAAMWPPYDENNWSGFA